MVRVLITTALPSPYQVELFDKLAASKEIDLTVLYAYRTHCNRSWKAPKISHEYSVLGELTISAARDLVLSNDLVVFSGYKPSKLLLLIQCRNAAKKPWAFWGERPGVVLPKWLGRAYRATVFPELREGRVSVWGIGSWAVEAYRLELGVNRHIISVPYYSDLQRFLDIERSAQPNAARKFVLSGTLIKRKGVDVLAEAFRELALEIPDVELHFIGEGPLRAKIQLLTQAIADRVSFHGFRQWEDLPALYSRMDVLCAPSRYDGWGLVVPEGLAAGLPVISTAMTGAAIELLDGTCGWVVPPGEKQSLLSAMREAATLTTPELVSRIDTARSVAARHDLNPGVVRVTDAVYSSLDHWNNH